MSASKSHPNLRDLVANTLKDFSNLQDVFPLIFPGKPVQKSSKKRPAKVEGVDPGDLPSHSQLPASAGALTGLGDFIQDCGATGPKICRQKINNLFTEDDIKVLEKMDRDVVGKDGLFSNGDQVHFDKYVTSVVETPKEKEKARLLFKSIDYKPSYALVVAAMICFGKRDPRHFFRDGLYVLLTFAQEMGVHLVEYLNFRGWLLHRQRKDLHVSYRRTTQCLQALHTAEQVVSYYRLSAIMENLFHALQSRMVTPEMPFYVESDREKKRREKQMEKRSVQRNLKKRRASKTSLGKLSIHSSFSFHMVVHLTPKFS